MAACWLLASIAAAQTAAPALRAHAAGAQKDEPRYPAPGSGHYIREVRDAGRFVVLEDKSLWEIAETNRYLTAEWQPLEGISVRYAGGDNGFIYEVDNIDRDEGASARWVRPTP
jgi:hypothetical protein